MVKALEQNPACLLDILQVAKWMLFNPTGDKHPTTMRTNGPDVPSVVEHIRGYEVLYQQIGQTISDQDEESLCSRVLVTLSRLAGERMQTLSDLTVYTRNLQRQESRGQ